MIYLKEAVLQDRAKIYNWLYFSDFSPFLNDLQFLAQLFLHYTFKEDYEDFFLKVLFPKKDGDILLRKMKNKYDLYHTSFHLMNRIAELDIWLKLINYTCQ